MEDYTNSQTQKIESVSGLAHPEDAEKYSEQAEISYQQQYGARNRYNHVKATSMKAGPFHMGIKWGRFLKFRDNITVFYVGTEAVGWLYHKQISANRYPCRFGGHDVQGPLNSIASYRPSDAR